MNEHEAWIAEWARKADGDCDSARTLLDSGRPLYDAACFHCQQCVEKYLKAFLLFSGKTASRSHDLEKLLQECMDLDPEFSAWEDACLVLNDYAVDVRYPDDRIETSLREAREALDSALDIRDFVCFRLPFLSR